LTMPPDADKLRQRKPAALVGPEQGSSPVTTPTNAERICSLSTLKPTEVCIEGTIYDISDFDHPGGDSIQLFGGNDVTVQYKMIHPYHTDKHLLKLRRVGKVADYTSEYVAARLGRFKRMNDEIRTRVPCMV